jgi:hypothetical protein
VIQGHAEWIFVVETPYFYSPGFGYVALEAGEM